MRPHFRQSPAARTQRRVATGRQQAVISGKLAIEIGENKPELGEGDAIYFESAVPHHYRKVGTRRTTALVVVVAT
ncbi:MAG TPA: cupin domain-containing protein [Bryobacteraceae bacterium]|nr:cupin domain-containing protein [Bryobacteraceae bacterium]